MSDALAIDPEALRDQVRDTRSLPGSLPDRPDIEFVLPTNYKEIHDGC